VVSWVIGQSADLTQEDTSTVSYPSPERGLRSLSALLEHQVFLRETSNEKSSFSVNRKAVVNILARSRKYEEKVLTVEAYHILSAYGIPVAPFKIAKTQKQILEVAKALEYPVVLKVCSREILHKSDINGVRIGIRDPNELKFHYEDMMSALTKRVTKIKIEGVIIQQMVNEGQELIVGVKRDPQFGHVIVFGWGGVFTEALKDFSCAIAPINTEDAERMISSTKVSKLLEGFRSSPPSDLLFLKECLLRISQLVSDFPEIIELDVNPLKVFPKSGLALDARVVID
jgi:acetyltransferase